MSYLVKYEMRITTATTTTVITRKPPMDMKVINADQKPFFSFVVYSFITTSMC